MRKGYIHIYTGAGKGKSTAALGLAFRAAGWGMRTCVFQFLKKGAHGELKASNISKGKIKVITLDQTHPAFCRGLAKKRDVDKLKEKIGRHLKIVKDTLVSERYDIIILDEIVNCAGQGFIKKDDILSVIKAKPSTCELILTGRGAPKWLIRIADYATEMRPLKHPYTKGIKARRGIEW